MTDIAETLQDAAPLAPPVALQTRHQRVPDGTSRANTVVKALMNWATYDEEGEESCPLCFETYASTRIDNGQDTHPTSLQHDHQSPEFSVITPCKHIFGSVCLQTWLKTSNSCPLCRRELISYGIQRNGNVRSIQRAHSTGALIDTFSRSVNPLQEVAPTMDLFHSTRDRSATSSSGRDMTTFQQQRWNIRMGRSGIPNPLFNDPRNVPPTRADSAEDTRAIRVRLPPTPTTHGHPPLSTTTVFTTEYVRRSYESVNITSYELRNEASNTDTRHPYPARQPANLPSDTAWRNWDYVSTANRLRTNMNRDRRSTRNPHSISNGVELAMGVGTVVGMPRGERTAVPPRGENSPPIRTESNNDYSIARAMQQVLGVGTVVGIPQAEWRSTASSPSEARGHGRTSGETQASSRGVTRGTRLRETSVEEYLASLPGIDSSIWARYSG
ncbi:hypothetical protein SBOR_0651 [Sclerotinia borealis F-4128]|uniref:RING-type domain-containing protein n=1 Tax=Sclerotinia borealis (strain F-4128) TaxID=1432307 RepID=W9CS99_SCLBF|nr:hypothetical protein SBOR_0651 [Sclerotinia borealis F-4128]